MRYTWPVIHAAFILALGFWALTIPYFVWIAVPLALADALWCVLGLLGCLPRTRT